MILKIILSFLSTIIQLEKKKILCLWAVTTMRNVWYLKKKTDCSVRSTWNVRVCLSIFTCLSVVTEARTYQNTDNIKYVALQKDSTGENLRNCRIAGCFDDPGTNYSHLNAELTPFLCTAHVLTSVCHTRVALSQVFLVHWKGEAASMYFYSLKVDSLCVFVFS